MFTDTLHASFKTETRATASGVVYTMKKPHTLEEQMEDRPASKKAKTETAQPAEGVLKYT